MTARDDLLRALRDGNIWGDHGRSEQLVDAYEREVRAEVAAELYDFDSGTCGCGCGCATFVDPDRCHECYDSGRWPTCPGCGKAAPKPKPGPPLIPSALYEGMLQHLLGGQPRGPRFTGVLGYLGEGER